MATGEDKGTETVSSDLRHRRFDYGNGLSDIEICFRHKRDLLII